MNNDQGAFVALPAKPDRVGIITYGMGLNRTVLWLDDYTFETYHFRNLIEAPKPPRKIQKYFKYNTQFPYLHECRKTEAQYVAVVSDAPDVPCSSCPAKSADCAHGHLRGCQSCVDTRQRFHGADKKV